jgi:hypothetical protein
MIATLVLHEFRKLKLGPTFTQKIKVGADLHLEKVKHAR